MAANGLELQHLNFKRYRIKGQHMQEAQGPVRGKGTVDITIREVEEDESVTYVAETDMVQYVGGWVHSNHQETEKDHPPDRSPLFETTPFEQWRETQCLMRAADAAATHVNTTLSTDTVRGGITAAVKDRDRAAFVMVQLVLDRDGSVVFEPGVDFELLVETTPATVDVTYVLDTREYSKSVPIYAEYNVLRYD